mmetsp:Transcript_31091/g.56490  ORF Transcript_31091/g.56490 Transcript_31091/m.56490 type:complete len:271 (+) Transcript_31091:171-983(+)
MNSSIRSGTNRPFAISEARAASEILEQRRAEKNSRSGQFKAIRRIPLDVIRGHSSMTTLRRGENGCCFGILFGFIKLGIIVGVGVGVGVFLVVGIDGFISLVWVAVAVVIFSSAFPPPLFTSTIPTATFLLASSVASASSISTACPTNAQIPSSVTSLHLRKLISTMPLPPRLPSLSFTNAPSTSSSTSGNPSTTNLSRDGKRGRLSFKAALPMPRQSLRSRDLRIEANDAWTRVEERTEEERSGDCVNVRDSRLGVLRRSFAKPVSFRR